MRNRKKSSCSKSDPVQLQSCRSKLATSLSLRKSVCSHSNQTAQPLQMAKCKSLENISDMTQWFWINCNQSLWPKQWQMKRDIESHLKVYIDWTSFNFCFEQSATENNYLLCYWPAIHNLILKVCTEFQVLIFSLFWGWWPASGALKKKCVKRKYFNFILCSM